MKLKDLDHPVLFLLFVSVGVLGVMSLGGWITGMLGWTGAQGFFKQGIAPHNAQHQPTQFG